MVLFVHGSSSSRHRPRNRRIAAGLQNRGFATPLMGLLTSSEEQLDRRECIAGQKDRTGVEEPKAEHEARVETERVGEAVSKVRRAVSEARRDVAPGSGQLADGRVAHSASDAGARSSTTEERRGVSARDRREELRWQRC
jgi:hypothetical protein